MRRLWIISLALALIPTAASVNSQPFPSPLTRLQCGGALIGTRGTINFPSGATCADDPANSRVNVTPTGGGGGSGANGVLGIDTCMSLDGNVSPLYTNAGGCLDPTEANVLQRLGVAVTLNNLACKSSANTGVGQSVTVTVRTQTGCTGGTSGSVLACTIGASSSTCTGTSAVAIGSGDCMSVSVTPSGALTTPVAVNCTVERTA